MKYVKELIILSSVTSLCGMGINKKREYIFRQADRQAISVSDAYAIFPKDVSVNGKIQFLKLFLYDRVKPCNREMMISVFSKIARIPHKTLSKILNGTSIKRKSFLNKLVRCGRTLNEAEQFLFDLYNILNQVEGDQNNHRETKAIYQATINAIFSPQRSEYLILEQEPLEPENKQIAIQGVEFELDSLERNFVTPNRYEILSTIGDN